MKTTEEIIQRIDYVISVVPGSAILSDEEWQTLKSAVLVQQTNNIAMDAIAALKNLVSAIDAHNAEPGYVHAPWVRDNKELSHARKVLQR
jgi:hypothetical protein